LRTLDDLCSVLEAPKRLVAVRDWKRVHAQLRLGAALELDGVVAAGISFLVTVQAEYPDENVTLLLQAEIKQKPCPFARIDWRGGPHPNLRPQCGEMRFIDAGRTHFHNTALHRHIDFDELFLGKLNLPVASAIEPEPADWQELLALSSALLHIENLTETPTPPWQPRSLSI
jgi:hypothetical protein